MSTTQIVVLAATALFVFWMVGAYNRLVALRNAIGDAWQMADEVLKKRGEAVAALVTALREPLAGEQGALDALQAAEAQVRTAAQALGARPVMAPLAAEFVAAEAQMASAASRLLALLTQHADLRGSETVAPHAAVLEESAQRLSFSRQMFNDAAQLYNEAARQFPTRLLTRMYGFGTAGRL